MYLEIYMINHKNANLGVYFSWSGRDFNLTEREKPHVSAKNTESMDELKARQKEVLLAPPEQQDY